MVKVRIDGFNKDAKQNLGFGGCHLRVLNGAGSHGCLGSWGYSLLMLRVCRSKLYRRFDPIRPSMRRVGDLHESPREPQPMGLQQRQQTTRKPDTGRDTEVTHLINHKTLVID